MGACGTKLSEEEERSRKIERMARELQEKEASKVKLLLLGAGESGKSTLFKQMKILYGKNKGFTRAEREQNVAVVYSNILSNLKTLVANTSSHTPAENQGLADKVMNLPDNSEIDENVARMIKKIWRDPGVQATWEQRGNFQVQDALEYYMGELKRIASSGYLPSDQDILRARVRTSGIVEEEYIIDKVHFVMYDVGGQRNERKKWIHCFENVTAVIFVAAISEYNQVLYEDNSVNRMHEALVLFEEICNSTWFKETSMILFLNKIDLFREKITHIPFRVDDGPEARNQDFEGPHCIPGTASAQIGTPEFERCYSAATQYLIKKFLARNHQVQHGSPKTIYPKLTCATATDQVKTIMTSTKDIVMRGKLRDHGFM